VVAIASGCGEAVSDSAVSSGGDDEVAVEHTGEPDERPSDDDVWMPDRWMWGAETDAVFVPYGIRLDRATKTIDLGVIPAGDVYMQRQDRQTAHLFLPEPHASRVLNQDPDALDILAGEINGTQILFLVNTARSTGAGALLSLSPFRLDSVLRGEWDAKIPLDLNDPEQIAKGSGGYILRRAPDGGVVHQSVSLQLHDFEREFSVSQNLFEDGEGSATSKLSVTGSVKVKNTVTGVANFKGRIARTNGWFPDTVYFDNAGSCAQQTHRIETLDADICVHQLEFYLENEGFVEMAMTVNAEAGFTLAEFKPDDPLLEIPLPPIVIPGAAGISLNPDMEVAYGFKVGATGVVEVGVKPKLEWSLPIGFEYVDHYSDHYNSQLVGPIAIPNGGSNADHHFRTSFNPDFTLDGQYTLNGDAFAEFKIVVGVGVPVTRAVSVKGLEFGVKLGVHGEWEPTAELQGKSNCATVFPFLEPFGKFGLGFEFDSVLSFLDDVDFFELEISGGKMKFKTLGGQDIEWTDGGSMCISAPSHRYIMVKNDSNGPLHVDAAALSRNSQTGSPTVYASGASGASGANNAVGEPDADSCSSWDSDAATVSPGSQIWLEFDEDIIPGDSLVISGSDGYFSLTEQGECNINQNPASISIRVCESASTGSCSASYTGSMGNQGHGNSNAISIPGI
jgi:hypothetical protein